MRILVINPNTTGAMTAHVVTQLGAHLPAGTRLYPSTAELGPRVIADAASFEQGAAAALHCLERAQQDGTAFDRVLLACFGDPGLETLQARAGVPVVGLAQASMRAAEDAGMPYAIVTAGAAWEPLLLQRLAGWGASERFLGVEVMQGSGLDVLADPGSVMPSVVNAIARARHRGARQVILGGAVFGGFGRWMRIAGQDSAGVLDCVALAAQALGP